MRERTDTPAEARTAASASSAALDVAPARLEIATPIGLVLLAGNDRALTHVLLPGETHLRSTEGRMPAPLRTAARQLEEYFSRARRTFSVPVELSGTSFQVAVWKALATIPYGETLSYGDLARRAGRPRAFRAVGQAMGANPVAIIYPCHRVVAARGHIGGYGGGLEMKRLLLGLEGSPLAEAS